VINSKELVDDMFDKIFSACEKDGTPTKWAQLPDAWTKDQERLLKKYDATTPYQGKPGPLPKDMQLWPVNAKQILIDDVWPQYQIGAYPYCFRLADTAKGNSMGQAPGTHWYHAHKHGSTALNVANGMTGAFVIEGQYDDDLRKFYGSGFRDQVLVIQQLSSTPFPLLMNRPNFQGPNSIAKPQLSVNGRLNPVVKMRPGEVQLWRLVNGAFRDAVQLQNFAPQGGLAWRQIAQDGVQLRYENYSTTLGTVNRMINMAPANRVDLLVKAPIQPGQYTLIVLPNAGLPLDPSASPGPQCTPTDKTGCIPLLTVSVEGPAVSTPQEFIQKESDFPTFPAYLADIPPVEDPTLRRTVTFGAGHNLIDGKSFNGRVYNQTMQLNSAEEWTILNQANDKAHPFHIHVNPFQITEVFEPNAPWLNEEGQPEKDGDEKLLPLYILSETDRKKSNQCLLDLEKPEPWQPCTPIPAPYVWWDTFAIPTASNRNVTRLCQGNHAQCPQAIQPYVTCTTTGGTTTGTTTTGGTTTGGTIERDSKKGDTVTGGTTTGGTTTGSKESTTTGGTTTCTATIPGHFKMRSRFVDFTGTYVVHCHILIHEDRGMMQLVRVCPTHCTRQKNNLLKNKV
jgi:FtsP/CotA-like multicopper oxidase with cupredoxin domain